VKVGRLTEFFPSISWPHEMKYGEIYSYKKPGISKVLFIINHNSLVLPLDLEVENVPRDAKPFMEYFLPGVKYEDIASTFTSNGGNVVVAKAKTKLFKTRVIIGQKTTYVSVPFFDGVYTVTVSKNYSGSNVLSALSTSALDELEDIYYEKTLDFTEFIPIKEKYVEYIHSGITNFYTFECGPLKFSIKYDGKNFEWPKQKHSYEEVYLLLEATRNAEDLKKLLSL
jgi:hypothetical protein